MALHLPPFTKRTNVFLAVVLISTTVIPVMALSGMLSPGSKDAPLPAGSAGVPFKIVLTAAPSVVPAFGQSVSNNLFVKVEDIFGNPAYPQNPVTIAFSSSNTLVGTVPSSSITIYTSQYTSSTGFTTTYTPGSTVITASSPGLVSGSTTVTTKAPVASKLVIALTPPKVFADSSFYSNIIMVSLTDFAGKPAMGQQYIGVSLSSSNPSVGTVQNSLQIPYYSTYVQAYFQSTATAGTTTITATAAGFAPVTATMTTITPTANAPIALQIQLAPSTFPDNSPSLSSPVHIVLVDSSGNPAKTTSGTTVSLSSSNSGICTPSPSSVSISANSFYGTASLSCLYSPGSTTIMGSASGLTSGSAAFTLAGTAPAKLVVTPITPLLASGFFVSNVISVQVQDSLGNPVWPGSSCVTVSLSSSNSAIGTLSPSSTSICPQQTSTVVSFSTTSTTGSTTISALAGGLTTGTASLGTIGTVPSKLAIFLTPPKLFANSGFFSSAIMVQLETSSSTPAIAANSVTVSLSSGNTGVCNVTPGSITISPGSTDYASATIQTTGTAGSCPITAMAAGLTSASATLTTVAPTSNAPAKLSVITIPQLPLQDGATSFSNVITVQLLDSSNNPAGAPAGVTTCASLGSSDYHLGSPSTTICFSAGQTYVQGTFTSTSIPGTVTITAAVPGLPSASGSITTGMFTPFTKKYVFGSIPYLFYSNTAVVVGDSASTREALGAALFAPGFVGQGMTSPTDTTAGLLTSTQLSSSNLISVGFNNTLTTSKDSSFGVVVTQNAAWFNVTSASNHLSFNFSKATYPVHSFGLVLLNLDGTRATMLVWGYGWQGTFAASLFISNPSNWVSLSVSGKHILFLAWTDLNLDGLVEPNEISIFSSA